MILLANTPLVPALFGFAFPVQMWRNTRQQAVEGVGIEEIERLNHNICRQACAVVAHPYAPHAGAPCSLNAGNGIFDYNASVWRSSDTQCGRQVDFGVRLSSAYVFSGDDTLEITGCSQSLENYVNVRTGRRRSECLKPPLLMKPLYPPRHAGEGLDAFGPDEIAIQFLLCTCYSGDLLPSGCGTKPLGDDGVITLAK